MGYLERVCLEMECPSFNVGLPGGGGSRAAQVGT